MPGGRGPRDAAKRPRKPLTDAAMRPRKPLADLDQDDRVDHERDREPDRPPVQVPLDERAAAERAGAGPHPERAREPGVLARVHQDQEHQDDTDDDLDEAENRAHCGSMVARSMPCRISIASALSELSSSS